MGISTLGGRRTKAREGAGRQEGNKKKRNFPEGSAVYKCYMTEKVSGSNMLLSCGHQGVVRACPWGLEGRGEVGKF